MPAKRTRVTRTARRPPDAIERLLAALPIEDTEDNRQRLIECAYFHDYDLSDEARRRAGDILASWRS